MCCCVGVWVCGRGTKPFLFTCIQVGNKSYSGYVFTTSPAGGEVVNLKIVAVRWLVVIVVV